MPRWLPPLLKGAVSVALIAWLFSAIDPEDALRWLRRLPPGAALVAVLIVYLQGLVFALRWRLLLGAVEMRRPFLDVLRIVWIGLFFNQVLPSSVGGDAVRVWYLRRTGTTLSDAFLGVMAERVVQVLGLVLLIAAGLPALSALLAGHPLTVVVPLLVVALLTAVGAVLWLDKLPAAVGRWPGMATLGRLAAMLRGLFARPATLLPLLALSVAGHALLVLAVYVLAAGLGLSLTVGQAFVLVPLAMFVTLIPVSIAGWGVREGALAAGFSLVGIPLEAAVVVSVLFGFAVILQGLPGGALWIMAGGARPPAVAQSATAAGSE